MDSLENILNTVESNTTSLQLPKKPNPSSKPLWLKTHAKHINAHSITKQRG